MKSLITCWIQAPILKYGYGDEYSLILGRLWKAARQLVMDSEYWIIIELDWMNIEWILKMNIL